ncbi:unnamed protein product, partial [Amoebophrya sp. A120]
FGQPPACRKHRGARRRGHCRALAPCPSSCAAFRGVSGAPARLFGPSRPIDPPRDSAAARVALSWLAWGPHWVDGLPVKAAQPLLGTTCANPAPLLKVLKEARRRALLGCGAGRGLRSFWADEIAPLPIGGGGGFLN